MEKKDYFYLKEIILGLKDEYVKHQQQLLTLKKQVIIEDKKQKIENFDFWISQNFKSSNPEMYCVIEMRKNIIKRLIENIQHKTGTFIYGRDNHKCIFDDNGDLKIYEAGVSIIGVSPKFHSQVNEILTSPFVNNILIEMIKNINGNNNPYVSINPSLIRYMQSLDENSCISLECIPKLNGTKVYLHKYDSNLTVEELNDILYSRYPKSKLSDYHRSIIELNPSTTKSINILETPDFSDSSFAYPMELEEKTNEFILKRIKK